jgi:hypothetical protein
MALLTAAEPRAEPAPAARPDARGEGDADADAAIVPSPGTVEGVVGAAGIATLLPGALETDGAGATGIFTGGKGTTGAFTGGAGGKGTFTGGAGGTTGTFTGGAGGKGTFTGGGGGTTGTFTGGGGTTGTFTGGGAGMLTEILGVAILGVAIRTPPASRLAAAGNGTAKVHRTTTRPTDKGRLVRRTIFIYATPKPRRAIPRALYPFCEDQTGVDHRSRHVRRNVSTSYRRSSAVR